MPDNLEIPNEEMSNGMSHSSEQVQMSPDTLRILSRSPHPYHRRRSGPQDGDDSRAHKLNDNYLPSPSLTPSPYNTGDEGSINAGGYRTPRKLSTAPSDSGTEADDEGFSLLKGLPAPPTRPKKGLRGSLTPVHGIAPSPLITPAYLSGVGRRFSAEFGKAQRSATSSEQKEALEAERKLASFRRRRAAELRRRGFETILLACVGGAALMGKEVLPVLQADHLRELSAHLCTVGFMVALYPLQLCYHHSTTHSPSSPSRAHRWIRIPSAFDPAPLLYPVLLPGFVAMSFLPSNSGIFLPNIILSLCTLPGALLPGHSHRSLEYSPLHWLISLLPLFARTHGTETPLHLSSASGLLDERHSTNRQDLLTYLYPLHHALLPVLHYLTTTSLLSAELQLLSVSMINVLLYSSSPQNIILKALLWTGGVSIFLLCGRVLKWVVTIARIPSWRFRPAGRLSRSSTGRLHRSRGAANGLVAGFGRTHGRLVDGSDADEDGPPGISQDEKHGSLNLFGLGIKGEPSLRTEDGVSARVMPAEERDAPSTIDSECKDQPLASRSPRRRHTFSSYDKTTAVTSEVTAPRRAHHKRRLQSTIQSYLSMTQQQAQLRQWLYAGYVYVAIFLIVMAGLRPYIGRHALSNHEPIGWALGYMFGNIRAFRLFAVTRNLERWIPLPEATDDNLTEICRLGWVEHLRRDSFGEANTRLLLCVYWLLVLAVGMAVVLRLQRVVEVDTRRKVFHGMMVAMLLPSTFIDPVFAGFALILILVVFLLLDLFRASQLPPLSKPLAFFLTPYVDGRDLRGPVVVSHIFLLIGCAIPLWLSLASIGRTGRGPWAGWDVGPRDVSMVSGVVCVGMGDAAASLIGRRYGRRKWPWSGGKSLEGSLAFAAAVTVGLGVAKAWLRVGGWSGGNADAWYATLGKAVVASSGASLTEAVLTGGNDNVIVPVTLWLLGRGLGI